MIVEIEKPRPSCESVLDYNEDKVLHGAASLVAYANMDSVARKDIYALFESYQRKVRYGTVEVSFHASVNPSETDTCTEDDILSFISEMMGHIGLGAQPYLVYRHFDIARGHYHVVSVRVDSSGRKINNYYEKRNVSAFMRRVAPRFSFSVPEKGEKVRDSEDLSVEPAPSNRVRFNPRLAVAHQMRELFSRALGYEFDTLAQLSCILSDMGLKVSVLHPASGPSIMLQGINKKGEPVTRVFTESDIGAPLHSMMKETLRERRRTPRKHNREKERVRSLVRFAFEISKSEGHFVNILKNKGIIVHLSRTKESGDVFGVTFVDHNTRTVFKASELHDIISIRMIQEALSSGKWRVEDRGYRKNDYISRSRKTLREEALKLRDLHVGTVARILKPIGQPHGSSWSGKTSPTKEDLRAEWDQKRAGAAEASFEDRRYVEKYR